MSFSFNNIDNIGLYVDIILLGIIVLFDIYNIIINIKNIGFLRSVAR